MLDERILGNIDIGNVEGFLFLCKHLKEGITSLKSLHDLRLHNVGRITINIEKAMILIKAISEEYPDAYKSLIDISDKDKKQEFKIQFSKILLKYILENNVLDISKLHFEENTSKFFISQNGIQLKHACYRNMLLSFDILKKRKQGGYYYNLNTESFKIDAYRKRINMSQQQLLENIEKQRKEGEKGEEFVLSYERRRLMNHPFKDKIQQISIIDVAAGYDIVSYLDCCSRYIDKFIEVKTFKGRPHFHWSANERKIATEKGEKYFLYLINIDKMEQAEYKPIIIQNPIFFLKDNIDWKYEIESLLFEEM